MAVPEWVAGGPHLDKVGVCGANGGARLAVCCCHGAWQRGSVHGVLGLGLFPNGREASRAQLSLPGTIAESWKGPGSSGTGALWLAGQE
jgi:hypothetical protein